MVFHGILSECQNLEEPCMFHKIMDNIYVPQNNGVERVKDETVKYSKKNKKTHTYLFNNN